MAGEFMSDKKPMVLSLSNIKRMMELCDILHVYDNTEEPVRIIRKHKADISIFPNDLWSEERILELL